MATLTRNNAAALQAAAAASDAARVLQARQQESKAEPKVEARTEAPEPPRNDPPKVRTENKVVARNPIRESAMESIRANRGEKEPEPEKKEEKPVEAEKPAEKPEIKEPERAPTKIEAAAPVEVPEAKPEEQATLPPPVMVKVKVDGEEFDVPQAEVDAAGGIGPYQRDKASENRLKKANEALAESKRIAAWIAQQAQVQQKPAEPEKPVNLQKQELLGIIRYGEEADAVAALDRYAALSNPRIDPNLITQRTVSEVQRLQAVNQFATEFADLDANPLLKKLVVVQVQERLPQFQQQGGTDWLGFYRQIGNEVRNVIGRQSQPPATVVEGKPAATTAAQPTGTPSQVSDKEARKATIVNLPTAAARAALPETSKPETREESLARMKKSRGIQTG